MAPMMDSTEPKAELKKHYKSAQMQKTHAELKEKAASGDEAALDDETASDDKATSDKSELYGIWIAWCQAQQKYGFAILHRIKALQALSSNTNTSTSTTIDERISHLKILYHKHLEALQRSWAEWTAQPTGGRAGDHDESELPRITYEIRQPLAWEEHQKTCERRGGCCDRACGCCSKPLHEIYIYSSDERGRRDGVSGHTTVYGHCTRECLCCNQYYGRYSPDPRLPKIDPALFKDVIGDGIYFYP